MQGPVERPSEDGRRPAQSLRAQPEDLGVVPYPRRRRGERARYPLQEHGARRRDAGLELREDREFPLLERGVRAARDRRGDGKGIRGRRPRVVRARLLLIRRAIRAASTPLKDRFFWRLVRGSRGWAAGTAQDLGSECLAPSTYVTAT